MRGGKLAAFRVGIAAVGVAIAVSMAACGDDSEADVDDDPGDPSIRGSITTKTDATDGGDVLGHLLIEGEIEPDTQYDKASVRVDEDTEIYRLTGGVMEDASWDDLAQEQTVEAWFEGPVAESYPVQAYAGRIVITE
jgi:beta-N-acetylhexosaminidase